MSGSAKDDLLTSEQSAVVEAIVKGERVVAKAGAGSGKTRTLVESYARLLQIMKDERNPFDRILAITFTNEGAYKLKKSIYERTGGDVRALLTDNISTIHSFCNTVLSSHLIELAINPGYEIVEESMAAEAAYAVIDEITSASYSSDKELRDIISYYGYEGGGRGGIKEMIYGTYGSMRMQGVMREEAERVLEKGRENLTTLIHSHDKATARTVPGEEELFISGLASTLGKYLLAFWDRFEKVKRSEGRITFDDVLYYTYMLLRENPEIRSSYVTRFRYILMDEFQDTDRLQFEIVSMISGDGRKAFVGDVKQAIYEWRNADPSIMGAVEKEIGKTGRGSVLELTENFRSSPQLIDFFNLLFPQIFDGQGITYSRMRHANKAVTDSAEPAVRILLPGGSNAPARRKNEAELICSEVQRLLDADIQIYDEQLLEYRKAALKDIAILFRSRSPVWTYERALREHGIAFIHVQSESFFEKDEIVDLMNYLNHLADPADHFYTFAVLRSPIYGCSDDVLLTLSKNRFDLRKTLEQAAGRDRKLLSLFNSVDEYCSGRMNSPAYELISKVIERTGLDLVYLASSGGKQAYANILKLLDMVRGMGGERQMGLREAIRRLNRRAESGQGEAEYPLNDEKSDALKLMTVHASKGQEFPVVFIADSSRGRQNDIHTTFYNSEFGVVPGPPRRANDRFAEQVDEMNVVASEERQKKTEQEDRRVLYVALTRARQLLYLSHFDIGGRQDRSWNGILSRMLPAYGGSPFGEIPGGCPVMFVRDGNAPSKAEPESASAVAPVLMEGVRKAEQVPRISVNATDLSSFMVCPYRLKLASGASRTSLPQDSRESMERGRLAHQALEDYNYEMKSLPLNEELLLAGSQQFARGAELFVDSAYGRTASKASREGKLRREFPFMILAGRHTVSGKADLVAEGGEETMIVDYKTGDVAKHGLDYGNQLMIYALALHRLTEGERFRLVTFALDHTEQTIDRVVGRDELRLFEQQLDTSLQEMAQGVTAARPSGEKCSNCSFRAGCDYRFSGQERLDC